jgi:hypothetical protein
VLLVKTVAADGTSYGGFVWPRSGPVDPGPCSREPTCQSGGLFGWPWGTGCGDGRDVEADGLAIVFAARPENVVLVDEGPKAKAVTGADGCLPEVVFAGSFPAAMARVAEGRARWIEHVCTAGTSQAGSGDPSTQVGSGDGSTQAGSGDRSTLRSLGRSCALATTGEGCLVEISPTSAGVVCADRVCWRVRHGAVLLWRWRSPKPGYGLFVADEMGVADGDEIVLDAHWRDRQDVLIATRGERESKMHTWLEEAFRRAGRTLTGKTPSEEIIRRAVERIIAEENCTVWMTPSERTAMEMDASVAKDEMRTVLQENDRLRKLVERLQGEFVVFPTQLDDTITYREVLDRMGRMLNDGKRTVNNE